MYGYLIVFLGAGLDGALRHGVNVLAAWLFGIAFPMGTFLVNASGSLVMGMLAGYFAFWGEASQEWRLFLTTGALGGYTTFSAFALDAVLLWERGATIAAVIYVIASVTLAIFGLFFGVWLLRPR